MKNNLLIPLIVGAVVIAGASFFAGMHFGAGAGRQMRAGAFANGGAGGPGRGGAGGTFAAGFAGRGGAGGMFTTGEVISSDDTSVTVKLRDGGSKNIFFASSTSIGKMAEGSKTDLTPGTNVMVTGSANQDGSITANSIQIRPAMPAPDAAKDPAAKTQ